MADGDRFDPRFDPAFQRGFEPDAPVAPAPAAAPKARPAVEPPLEVVDRRADRTDPDTQPRAPRRSSPVARRDEDEDAAPSRRNPFLIAVLAIAVLLIVGSSLVFARLPEWRAAVQGDAVVDFATLEVAYFAVPLLFTLALASIIAVLLIAATRWRRDRED